MKAEQIDEISGYVNNVLCIDNFLHVVVIFRTASVGSVHHDRCSTIMEWVDREWVRAVNDPLSSKNRGLRGLNVICRKSFAAEMYSIDKFMLNDRSRTLDKDW